MGWMGRWVNMHGFEINACVVLVPTASKHSLRRENPIAWRRNLLSLMRISVKGNGVNSKRYPSKPT